MLGFGIENQVRSELADRSQGLEAQRVGQNGDGTSRASKALLPTLFFLASISTMPIMPYGSVTFLSY